MVYACSCRRGLGKGLTIYVGQVIIAGSAQTVEKAIRAAEKYREELLQRGVLLIPLVWSSKKSDVLKKKGFGKTQKPAAVCTTNLGKFIIEADCLNIKNGSKLVFIGIDVRHDFHQSERRPSVEFVFQ